MPLIWLDRKWPATMAHMPCLFALIDGMLRRCPLLHGADILLPRWLVWAGFKEFSMAEAVITPRRGVLLGPVATVFVASGAIMSLELVAGRVIAPYVGSSLYTWTAIIALFMGGMSLGNYVGGKVAERFRVRRALGVLLLAGGLGVALLLALNPLLGQMPFLIEQAWPIRILLHVLLLFFLPATILGTVTPLVAKMALGLEQGEGRTIGLVFAFGVAGSIVGTFLTGFGLVAWFAVPNIVLTVAVILGCLGACYIYLSRGETAPAPTTEHRLSVSPAGSLTLGERFAPYATVFASNAAFMAFELAGARLLAREFGGSIYTWTTIIGVVLAGITLGNYLGGRLADRRFSSNTVALLFALSAFFTLISPAIASLMGTWRMYIPFLMNLSWPAQITVYSFAAFFLPNVFIGMISPVVVKRTLAEGRAQGTTVGDIYAWGSIGSITATLLTGYFLIAWIGSQPLIALVSAFLGSMAFIYHRNAFYGGWAGLSVVVAIAALLPFSAAENFSRNLGFKTKANPLRIYETETNYSYMAVIKESEDSPVRNMLLDNLIHSRVNLEDPTELRYEYEWIYTAVLDKFYPIGKPITTMVLGGGAYAYPHYLEVVRPEAYVEVSEIDPQVTQAAFDYFGLPEDTTVAIYNMDARNRIADLLRSKASGEEIPVFDVIFGDTINDYSLPHHLTTYEFALQINALLAPDGIYMLNMIDMLSSGRFLAAVYNTNRQVFPYVYVFNTGSPETVRDTFVMISAKRPLNLSDIRDRINRNYQYFGNLLAPQRLEELVNRNSNMILTDSYAPVENLISPVVRTRHDVGEIHFQRGIRLMEEGNLDEAIEAFEAGLKIHAQWPDAYFEIAKLQFAQGRLDEAEKAFEQVIIFSPRFVPAIIQLGRIELERGNHAAAIERFESALRHAPEDVTVLFNLGFAHASEGNLDTAIRYWKQGLELTPNHPDTLYNLTLAYVMQEKYNEAWEVVAQMRAEGIEPDEGVVSNLRNLSGRTE